MEAPTIKTNLPSGAATTTTTTPPTTTTATTTTKTQRKMRTTAKARNDANEGAATAAVPVPTDADNKAEDAEEGEAVAEAKAEEPAEAAAEDETTQPAITTTIQQATPAPTPEVAQGVPREAEGATPTPGEIRPTIGRHETKKCIRICVRPRQKHESQHTDRPCKHADLVLLCKTHKSCLP